MVIYVLFILIFIKSFSFSYDSIGKVLHYRKLPKLSSQITEKNKPIILLHGLLGSAKNFNGWANYLHEHLEFNFDIYCLDLRNHGKSSRLGEMEISYKLMASDLLKTMDSLGIDKCHLIGHSMGGKVAAAAATLYDKERFSSLCIIDISPIIYSKEEFKDVYSSIDVLKSINYQLPLIKSYISLKELINSNIADPRLAQFILSNIRETEKGIFSWTFNFKPIVDHLDHISNFDVDGLNEYKGPVLFLKGQNSNYLKDHHISTIKKLFPNFHIQEIKKAGHWVHFDNPVDSTQSYSKFIQSIPSRARET